MIKISKQSGKKLFLSQNVVFFVFHQVRRREMGEGEKSSGAGIFNPDSVHHKTVHNIREIFLVCVCRAVVKTNC